MGQKTLKVDKIVPEGGILHIDGQVTAISLQETSNPWEPVNDVDIKFISGNVGVGTDTPTYKLDVHGTANVGVLTTTSISGDGSGLSNIQTSSIPDLIQAQWTMDNDDILYFRNSNVGIGTDTPAYKLDVHGSANVGALNVTSISGDGSGLTNIDGSAVIGLVNQWTSVQDDLRFEDGKVGVGKGTPNHTFDVNGNVNATTLSLSDSGVPVYLTPNASAESIAQWSKEIGGDTNIVRDIAIDSNGNTFVTGEYTSSSGVTIGTGVSLSATTETNVYLIKYIPGGTTEWALNLKGNGKNVAVDSDGNVYISGTYNSPSTNVDVPSTDGNPLIGKLVPTTRVATFLIKYDNVGVAQWATHLDGTDVYNGDDIGRNLAIDSDSNVYLTGSYNGDAYSYANSADDIGPNPQLPLADNNSVFLVKYNSSGTVQWVKGINASGDAIGYGVATDTTSNVYITGEYVASTEVDVGDSKTLPVTTGVASFLIKYDTTGTTQWTKKIDGSSTDKGVSLVTGKDGNVHILGNYTSGAVVISPFITLPDTSGNTTTFLVTYDTQGVAQWATTIDGSGNDVVTDSTGTIFVTGEYSSSGSNISSTDGKNVTLENPTGDATFLVEYSPNGILRSSTHIDGTSNENRKAVATDTLGENVYISGTTGSNSVIYNSDGTPSGLTLTSGPGFVVKYEISKSLKLNVSSNLEVGTANLFVDTQTSRVGLGTRTPEATLHVEGNVYASSNLEIGGNVYASSNLEVGTANLFVDTEVSRVGVRTRVPGFDLDVNGDINFTGDFYKNGVLFTSVIGATPWSTLESNISYTSGGVAIGITDPEATLHVEGNVYASSNLEVGGANLFVDTQTSRVGLGTRTPEATLHVEGNVYASSNLEVGGANLFVDTQTSRVGLGTRTPEATLHVEGNVYASSNLEVGSNISVAGLSVNRFPIVGTENFLEDSSISKSNGTIVISSDVEILGNILVDGNSYTVESNSLIINDRVIGIANNNVSHELDIGIVMEHPGKNIAIIHHGSEVQGVDPHDHEITIGYTQNTVTDNHITPDSNNITVNILGNLVTQNNVTISENLEVGTANLFVDTQTSRIGIGTRTPESTLHIEGNVYASSNLEVGGANLFVDTQTSRVGLGTRTPESTLHVEGNVYASSNLEVGGANLFVDTQTSRVGLGTRTPESTLHVEGNVYASSNLEVGGANLFVDTQTSRVGLGTRTPESTLHVEGNVYASSNLEVGGANLFVDTQTSRVGLGTRTPESTLHVEGNVYASSNLEVGGANLFVDTQTSRVGLGTRTPESTLHVEGNVYASSNLEVGGANLFVDTQTSRVGLGTRTPESTLHVEGNVYASSNLEVGGANLFVDTQTSRVGVGTATPKATLHVEGDVYMSSNLEVDGSTISSIIVSDEVPNVSWAKTIGGSGTDERGNAIATDSAGNVYVIGYYRLGDITIGTDTLTNEGQEDVFVAKYDTSGTVQWAKRISGSSPDKGYSISVDSSGNVYATGQYRGTADFGSGRSLTSGGSPANDDAFVVKYDTDGAVQWARSIGGENYAVGHSISVDSSGNVYVTGEYVGTISIGDTTLSSNAVTLDAFVAKYDTSGTFDWARSIGGTSSDSGNAIATDSSGNVYVTGYYDGTAVFGPSTSLNSSGSSVDAFVAKYDTSGTIQWAKSIGGTSSETGMGIATDSAGNVYVTGNYQGTANFASGTSLNSSGSSVDAFVAKYDTNGTFDWAESIGGSSTDSGNGIATDSAGNVYVIGEYVGTIVIGSTTLTNTDSSFYKDIFVAKYNTSGTVQWATRIGGFNGDFGLGIATDSRGNVYVTGYYEGTITIGSTTLTNTDGFLYDAFVAKYSPPKNLNINTSLEVGGANLFVDTQTSRVGVGTATPKATLHVEGEVYMSSNLEVGGATIVSDKVRNVSWAKSIGNTSLDRGYGIATDSSGNVYVVGRYYDTADFGSGTTLTHSLNSDSFVAKYDTSGAVIWAISIGGTGSEYGYGIATDSSGNVYVTGVYYNSITIGTTQLSNLGSSEAFVAKYDTNGAFEWAESIGGSGSQFGFAIATDSTGNVYVTGRYNGTVYFGSGTSFTSDSGSIDVFVAKYDTTGAFEWAESIGGASSDEGSSISADSSGNVYVTGQYKGTVIIGTTELTNAGNIDVFIAKYNTSGVFQWARSISGPGSEFGNGIATDSDGNVYVTGRYENYVDFDLDTRLTSGGGSDGFVAKYDTNGTFRWAKHMSGSGFDVGFGIATSSAGNVYVTGRYEGTADFGPSTSLTVVGGQDAFIVKYDTSGTVQWAESISGGSNVEGTSISVDGSENVYVTGQYFGSITIGSTILTNAGNNDAFIAKYSPSINLNIKTSVDVQGDLYVSGTTTNVSDKRLKSNVQVIGNALEKVDKLSGYTFTMNDKRNAGVIAQEVLEVLPEVVGGSEETTYSVAYGNMAGLFIEAIKELKREIEILKTKD